MVGAIGGDNTCIGSVNACLFGQSVCDMLLYCDIIGVLDGGELGYIRCSSLIGEDGLRTGTTEWVSNTV